MVGVVIAREGLTAAISNGIASSPEALRNDGEFLVLEKYWNRGIISSWKQQ
jgi:hypothetical protein